jgi:hypothetical protein
MPHVRSSVDSIKWMASQHLQHKPGDFQRADTATVPRNDRANGYGIDITYLILGVDLLRECHSISPR